MKNTNAANTDEIVIAPAVKTPRKPKAVVPAPAPVKQSRAKVTPAPAPAPVKAKRPMMKREMPKLVTTKVRVGRKFETVNTVEACGHAPVHARGLCKGCYRKARKGGIIAQITPATRAS